MDSKGRAEREGTYYGRALAVIHAGEEGGETSVKVSAPGLEEQTIVIR